MKTALKLFVFLLAVSFVFAQGKRKKPHMKMEKRVEMFTEYLDEKLDLNDKQEEKIRAILKEEAPKIKEIHEKYPGKENQAKRRELKRPILKETAKEIKSVLNDEQRKKFEAMIPGWRKKAREWYKEHQEDHDDHGDHHDDDDDEEDDD